MLINYNDIHNYLQGMKKQKIIRIGFDLDGVIAKHPMRGLWVWSRKLKEKILKRTRSPVYYYPTSIIERLAWKFINRRRLPFDDLDKLFSSLFKKKEIKYYLVTSRFKFLDKLTKDWLKKHGLNSYFEKIIINSNDISPYIFKADAINNLKLNFFIDDDLDVINYIKKKTQTRLFWIVPKYIDKSDNNDKQVVAAKDLNTALKNLSRKAKLK